jgi:hypothetical protein
MELLPHNWAAIIGSALTILIALRTFLRALVAACYALDLALDGHTDWLWPGRLGDAIDRFDDVLDRLPVKAPFVRGK